MAESPVNFYTSDDARKSGHADIRKIERDLALLRHSIRRRSKGADQLDPVRTLRF
jgi:hypothetical protein